uniref:Uncharacterized protein n=1 Tax=viral metagenome TaxID=1070528 RepID=A0A6C0JQQ1_9ZZZZ
MQRPDKQGKDYGNSNPWCTVKLSKKKSRNKPLDRSRESSRDSRPRNESSRRYDSEPDRFSRFQNESEKQHKPPPEPVYVPPPIPTGPNYANVTKEDEPEKDVVVNPEECEYRTIFPKIPTYRSKPTVRNQVPKPNSNSFGVWEHTYFKHVLELSDIFSEGANKLGIDTDSINFLDIFSNFVRDCSSGEISPFIEELDPKTDEFYLEYTIKRNEF